MASTSGLERMFNWLAALGGTVLALATAELLTRRFVPDPGLGFENRIEMFQEDALVGYRNKANFRGYAHGFVPIEVNSLGCRGGEIPTHKASHTIRILGLGDSVTWGVGVPDEATYLRILERRMNSKRAGSEQERVEVANCSVVGYSFYQELLTLQRDGVALAPDIVLVSFVLNDFYPTEDPFFNVHTFHEPRKENVQRRSYPETPPGRSYLYRFMRSEIRNLRNWVRAKLWPEEAPEFPNPRAWSEGSFEARAWPILQQQLRTMKSTTDGTGARLLILLFPTYQQLQSENHFPQSVIGAFLRSVRIEHIDLFDVYRGREQEAFRDSMHLTPTGHQITAEAVFQYVQDGA